MAATDQQTERALKRLDFLGLPLDGGGDKEALSDLEHLATGAVASHIGILDMRRTLRAKHRSEHARYIRQAGAVLTTSSLVAGSASFLGRRGAKPIRLFDLVIRLLSMAERNDFTVYLLGSTKDVLQQAERNLRDSFRRLRIVGRFVGNYSRQQEEQILLAIQKAQPTILLVGSGVPRAELWLLRNKQRLRAGLSLWVGDCFEVFAGRRRSAPSAMARAASAAFGSVLRPWRVIRLLSLIYFVALVLVYRIRRL